MRGDSMVRFLLMRQLKVRTPVASCSQHTHDSVQSPWMLESMNPRLKTRGGATHRRCKGEASFATSQAPNATATTCRNCLS